MVEVELTDLPVALYIESEKEISASSGGGSSWEMYLTPNPRPDELPVCVRVGGAGGEPVTKRSDSSDIVR